jgi:putative aldouronate transport system substrate-binding protein
MRKLVVAAFISAMVLSGTASVYAESADTSAVLKDGKDTQIDIVFAGSSSAPADLEEVEAAINSIVQETVDCTVNLNILEWGVYSEQQNLMLSSGEPIDIVLLAGNVPSAINSGQVMDISDLVEEYAPDALEEMGQYIEACYTDGALYGFPTYHEYAQGGGLVCLTSVLDELGVDPSTITTWDDVDELLAKVHEAHPEMDVLVPPETANGILKYYNAGTFDMILTDMVGIYADGSDGLTARNIYDTDEYKSMAQVAYKWNQAGYFISDPTTITDTRQTFLKAQSAFGYIGMIHPGTKTQESINAGVDVTTIPITDTSCGTSNVASIQYCVATATDSPEKTVAVMNLIYSNPDIQNLLRYGIEGKDYEVISDGVAGYPEGVDNTNVGWSNETWLTGNGSLAYAWETDPEDIWEQYREFNDSATFSPAYGFTYDSSGVKNEISAVQNVLNKYRALVESGLSDPDETMESFLNELDAAGMQNIVEDVQVQLDAWSAEQ